MEKTTKLKKCIDDLIDISTFIYEQLEESSELKRKVFLGIKQDASGADLVEELEDYIKKIEIVRGDIDSVIHDVQEILNEKK